MRSTLVLPALMESSRALFFVLATLGLGTTVTAKLLRLSGASVLSQWPAYLKALGDMAPGWCKDSGAR